MGQQLGWLSEIEWSADHSLAAGLTAALGIGIPALYLIRNYLGQDGVSKHARDPLYFTKRAKEIWYFRGNLPADQSDLDFINIAEFFVNNQK